MTSHKNIDATTRYVVLEKERGKTPLETIDLWKREHPAFTDIPASYAGRLDPMASGKLLVLLGDECKRQDQYTKLDKEYEIEVVPDLETDTGDTLGIPRYHSTKTSPEISDIKCALQEVLGTHMVPYPAFSSKTVNGIPLFLHTLQGSLSDIKIPTHAETIYRIELQSITIVSKRELLDCIKKTLTYVPRSEEPSKVLGADFRQDTIRNAWDDLLTSMPNRSFTVLSLRVRCASGTYMRTLAGRIAERLGTQGFALSIHRTRIGRYWHGFWIRLFS